MILKTYPRSFTTDLAATLALLEPLHARAPHLRFTFGAWELAALGDILVVAGTDEALAPIRGSLGPWGGGDLDAAARLVLDHGGSIVREPATSETGRFFYARHPDGAVVEYVEWKPELRESFIEAPRREGRLSSQV